jgi:hypothetical protein
MSRGKGEGGKFEKLRRGGYGKLTIFLWNRVQVYGSFSLFPVHWGPNLFFCSVEPNPDPKNLPAFTFGKLVESQSFGGFLRPGVKGVARRNHEAPSIPWPGRASRSGIPVTVCDSGRGDRRSPDRPASSCGSRSEPSGKGPTRPMLSAGNALNPGPRERISPK